MFNIQMETEVKEKITINTHPCMVVNILRNNCLCKI